MPLNRRLVDRERRIPLVEKGSEPLEHGLVVVDLRRYSLNWSPTGSLVEGHFVAGAAPQLAG